ncbi:Rv0361 family membrane protein [Mycobacterium sp. ML4]
MAGPHPPNPAVGAHEPQRAQPYGPNPPETLNFPHGEPSFGPGNASPATGYPGSPQPPRRRPKRLLIGILLAVALVAALTTAIVYGVRTNGANTGGSLSDASAKTAIQSYLNALAHKDIDGIMRNTLCGIYDAVKDKRSDQALAKLSSDAFRKQFSEVEVTTIDKIVYLSQYQAQVLFSMQATPAAGGPSRGQVQGIAQLLFQRGQILVCSYVLRTAGQY